jgi:hypothetical protein
MSFSVFAWRRLGGSQQRVHLVLLIAMAATLLSLPTRAAVFGDVSGTASAGSSGPTDFYGPVSSTSGESAVADFSGVVSSSAMSEALGSVSSSSTGSVAFGGGTGDSFAGWNGIFTNTSGVAADFVLTVQWTRDVSTSTQRPEDVFVPPSHPGTSSPLPMRLSARS